MVRSRWGAFAVRLRPGGPETFRPAVRQPETRVGRDRAGDVPGWPIIAAASFSSRTRDASTAPTPMAGRPGTAASRVTCGSSCSCAASGSTRPATDGAATCARGASGSRSRSLSPGFAPADRTGSSSRFAARGLSSARTPSCLSGVESDSGRRFSPPGRVEAMRSTDSRRKAGPVQKRHTPMTTGCAVNGRWRSGVNLTPSRTASPSRTGRVRKTSAWYQNDHSTAPSVSSA